MRIFNKQQGKSITENATQKSLISKVKDRYQSIENKKVTATVIGVWAAAFLSVIVVCRMNDTSRQAAGNQDVIIIESQTTMAYETGTSKEDLVKTSEKKTVTATMKQTTTQSETTTEPQTTTVAPSVAEAIAERETIPIEKLEVSNEVMYDDVVIVKKPVEEIVAAPADDELVAPVVNVQELVTTNYQVENNTQPDEILAAASTDTRTVQDTPVVLTAKEITTYHNCIDISYHQGKIDWAKVKASGIEYAFIRVGYRGYETGKMGKDVRFDENVREATANGIKVGVYFFSQALTEQEALEEASVTLNYIKDYKISLPVVIDWETTDGYRTYNTISSDRLTNILSVFCDAVANKGYTPMIYMCKSDYLNRVNYASLAAKYEIWVAWYLEKYYTDNYAANLYKEGDKMPSLPFKYQVWQYTSKGSVNGIAGAVDMNIIVNNKKIYEPKLALANKGFTVNLNGSVDLMQGVSATDLEGNNAVNQVTVNITDDAGKEVSKAKALSSSGKYTVRYTFKGEGFSLESTARLFVRDIPKIYFENRVWADNNIRTVTYDYDASQDVTQCYHNIEALMKSKLSAVYYGTLEGISARIDIQDGRLDGLKNIIKDNVMTAGEYMVTYTVNDGKGLTNSKKIKLIVNIPPEEETTEPSQETETEEIDSSESKEDNSDETTAGGDNNR